MMTGATVITPAESQWLCADLTATQTRERRTCHGQPPNGCFLECLTVSPVSRFSRNRSVRGATGRIVLQARLDSWPTASHVRAGLRRVDRAAESCALHTPSFDTHALPGRVCHAIYSRPIR